MLAEAKREAERIVKEARERQTQLRLRPGGHQAGRARRRGHHRGRARPRAGDPPRRRGLRRRDPQHARGQPHEVHRRRPARARAPAGQGRAGRSRVGFAAEMAAKVEVLETDITTLEVDAIANAANTRPRPRRRGRGRDLAGGRCRPCSGRATGAAPIAPRRGGRDDRGRHARAVGHPRRDDARSAARRRPTSSAARPRRRCGRPRSSGRSRWRSSRSAPASAASRSPRRPRSRPTRCAGTSTPAAASSGSSSPSAATTPARRSSARSPTPGL